MQFGEPMANFPRVADKIAMMAVEIMIARQLTYYAARQKDSGRRCDLEAGMAKLLAARVAWAAAGGRGITTFRIIWLGPLFTVEQCPALAPKPDISLHRHKRRKGRECDMGPHKPYGLAPAFT